MRKETLIACQISLLLMRTKAVCGYLMIKESGTVPENETNMKNTIEIRKRFSPRKTVTVRMLLPVLLAGLLLSGCGQKPMLGVSTNDDNSISITADRAPKDSMGLGYLTVGENEQIVIDATGMDKGGQLRCRFILGVLGSDAFPEEPLYETTVSGGDSASFAAESGEYTVGVIADGKVTGSALIFTEPEDEMALLGYTPDSMIGTWSEKTAGRGNIVIEKTSDDRYNIQVNWGNGAEEMYVWTMTASPVESNVLHYDDCSHSIIVFAEDGSDSETLVYENGSGEFTLLSTNELLWQDDVEGAGQDTLFISEG